MGFGKDGKGVIIVELHEDALAALGQFVAKPSSQLVMAEDFRMIKTVVQANIDALTAQEAEGLYLGIANGELSATEIGEAMAVDGPLNRNDRLRDERANRFVKLIGHFQGQAIETFRTLRGPEGGSPVSATIRWTFSNPDGWQWFVWNQGGAALTTGSSVIIQARSYGVWVS